MSFFEDETNAAKIVELHEAFVKLKGRITLPVDANGTVSQDALVGLATQSIQESLTMQHQNAVISSALTALFETFDDETVAGISEKFRANVDLKSRKLQEMSKARKPASSIIMPESSNMVRPRGA
jgi:hypothetical protein